MQEIRIIETLTEYQTLKEKEKFSLFFFGSESCAPCKAIKRKLQFGVKHIRKYSLAIYQ